MLGRLCIASSHNSANLCDTTILSCIDRLSRQHQPECDGPFPA